MSVKELLSLAPAGFFALGALLCLLFEATGTPIGARKQGERLHITLLTLATCAAVVVQVVANWRLADTPWHAFGGALVVDQLALAAQGGAGVLLGAAACAATSGLRERQADVGDAYALLLLHGAGLSVLASARELLTVAAALMLALAPLAPLAAIDRRSSQGAEGAVKLVQLSGVLLALLGFAAALQFSSSRETALCLRPEHVLDVNSMVSAALVLVVLLTLLAAVPVHSTHVDLVHGPPPFVGGLIATTLPLVATTLFLRWVSCEAGAALEGSPLLWGLEVSALLTLTVPALAALDQTRVDRVVAHLACAQAGPLLIAVLSQQLGPRDLGPVLLALSSLGASVLGAVVVQASLTSTDRGGATWERWSGAGRMYPLLGLSMVWLWSSLAGLPGTIGFASRVVTAQAAFGAGLDLLGIIVLVAPVLAAAPVLRLTIFLFAKTPDPELRVRTSGWRSVVVAVATLVVFVLGIFPLPLLELGNRMASALAP